MRYKNSKRGVALFITLMILFLLSIVTVVVLLTAYNYANVTENQIKRMRAITLAEAGIHYAYFKLRTDPAYSTTYIDEASADTINPDESGYNVLIWIDSSSGRDAIKSKVVY
ncbi:MAG: hypothetical protein HQ566_00120 [Candidatus Omnitrophica bacterium]|nr:hypothetical protein [Candidatus Omnitrophota bacterium]